MFTVVVCADSETKVVLNGHNTVQLTDLATKAGNLGLPNYSVQDAGKTQVMFLASIYNVNNNNNNRFTALWNLSGKTRVSRYQKNIHPLLSS